MPKKPFRVWFEDGGCFEDLFTDEITAKETTERGFRREVVSVELIEECTRCHEKQPLSGVYGTFLCRPCERERDHAYKHARQYMHASERDEIEEYYSIETD